MYFSLKKQTESAEESLVISWGCFLISQKKNKNKKAYIILYVSVLGETTQNDVVVQELKQTKTNLPPKRELLCPANIEKMIVCISGK